MKVSIQDEKALLAVSPAVGRMELVTATRQSPIAQLVADAPAAVQAALHHPVDAVKLGAKGPRLVEWAEQHALALPARIYDTRPVGADGVLARVGADELILECRPEDALWARLNAALDAAEAGVYRMEQQAATLVVRGHAAPRILAQACAVDLAQAPVGRLVYAQVAGAACGILPHGEDGPRAYRLWVEYSLAAYLWEALATVAADIAILHHSGPDSRVRGSILVAKRRCR